MVTLNRNPLPKLEVGRVLDWHEAVAELRPELKQLLKPFVPKTRIWRLPFDSNTLERLNTLRCHTIWLSFMIQLAVVALSRNPLPKVGVGRKLDGHEVVAELRLELKQFLKSFVPKTSTWRLKFEFNTLERSNTLLCQVAWLSFLVQLTVVTLSRNPLLKVGVGRILLRYEVVAELRLDLKQFLKLFVPKTSTWRLKFEFNTLERSNTLLYKVT